MTSGFAQSAGLALIIVLLWTCLLLMAIQGF